MRHFAQLVKSLDQSNKTTAKLAALSYFFKEADDRDKIWTIALFSGRRPRRAVSWKALRDWCSEVSGIPAWLYMECASVVGDSAETLSLLLPPPKQVVERPLHEWISFVLELASMDTDQKRKAIKQAWEELDVDERFAFHKLLTGAMRLGVSQNLMTQALAKTYDIPKADIAHRLMGAWSPQDQSFQELILEDNPRAMISRPYPFYLAHALDQNLAELGTSTEWQAEWKWDGIRSQCIKRDGQVFIWSRGEELVNQSYPELVSAADKLPEGTVFDAEILCWKQDRVAPFQMLQSRIGRKRPGKKVMREAPVVFMAYDLLEWEGVDIRNRSLEHRRSLLEDLVKKISSSHILISEKLDFDDWTSLTRQRLLARDLGSEGLMLKALNSPYEVGRVRGNWWKWKLDPWTVDAVLVYAQRGTGRRASLYTDYTFAVWNGKELVNFCKAYSGLDDEEIRRLDRWIRSNTLETHGPVRILKPDQVFEIAFEGISRSKRHRSGIALRFPRIHRWRTDKPIEQANTLADLEDLLQSQQSMSGDRPEGVQGSLFED